MDLSTLRTLSPDQLNQLFTDSYPGPIPDGPVDGVVLTAAGISRAVSQLWKGKIFDAARGQVINRLRTGDAISGAVYIGKSLMDRADCIIVDYSMSPLVGRVRDELREVAPGLYLGKVYKGPRAKGHFALHVLTRT